MEFKHWEDKAQTKTMKRNIYAMIFTGFTLVTISLIFYLYLGDNFKFACLIGKIEQYKCVNQAPEYPPDYCGRKSDNPLLKEELRPGCDVISDGFLVKIPEIHIKINSKGLRDYEYEIEKPVNTFRIVAIGDSHTFGWGVELNKSYPKVLEKLLNKKTEKIKYEVLNFGIPGYGTFEEVEFFKQLGMKFGPDLVILQYGGDDISNMTQERELEKEIIKKYAEEMKINENDIDEHTKVLLQENVHGIYLEYLERNFENVWNSTRSSLEDFGKVTNRTNTSVLIFTLYGEEEWDVFNFKEQVKDLKEISKKYGWSTLFSIMPEYFHNYKWWDLILHPEDPHPSDLAYELIAKDVAKKLLEDKLLDS